MSNTLYEMSKIDFALLKEQRWALLEITDLDEPANDDRREKLSGLMYLLDHLVDALIADGIPHAEDALLSDGTEDDDSV